MRVIVVGASGDTGRHLVSQASCAGHRVVAVVRNPDSYAPDDPAVEVRRADVLDADVRCVTADGVRRGESDVIRAVSR